MSDIPHQIYNKLNILLPSLPIIPEYTKSTAVGFMDLNLDQLNGKGKVYIIALSHYYKHSSGDMIPDPDMTMRVDTKEQTIE